VSVGRQRLWAAGACSAALFAALVAGGGDRAAAADEQCLSADPPALTRPAHRLRFGITPLAAGSAGASQLEPKPQNRRAALAALRALRPNRRQLVLRLNRMFMSDGVRGIRRYAAIVDRYARAGFNSELQVRYHPSEEQEGNMRAWRRYVRRAASILGRRASVKALTITNEGNLDLSPNTSDGSFEGVRQAIVTGTLAARKRLDRIGREKVKLGFTVAWRGPPDSDRSFWEELGRRGGPRFRRAVDYVGLQIYPHLFWPPAPLPGRSAGDEVVEALTLMRRCYMPKAHLGRSSRLWITENGYATNLGRSEETQEASLRSTVNAVHRYSGTLAVNNYRWFNLRDNNSDGPDLFDAVGLLRDDYSRKPAFAGFRRALRRVGARTPLPRG
jgi:hypothetical protein